MNRLALLAMLGAGCAIALSGCGNAERRPLHAWVSSPSVAIKHAIARVKASPLAVGFVDLPDADEAVPCVIHGGGPPPGLRIEGTCRSQVTFTNGRRIAAVVAFTELWPWKSFHAGGSPNREQHHTWRFAILSPVGRVKRLGDGGDFPPQSAM